MEEEIFHLYKEYERCKKFYDIKIYKKKFDMKLNLYSKYLDKSIKNEIYNIMNINHSIDYDICNQSIILNFWTSRNKKPRLFNDIINHINLVIYILNSYKKLNDSFDKIKITIIDLNKPKKFNYDSKNLTPKNVNSGVTVKINDTIEVLIYRREELSRVIVHEMIHVLDFDDKSINVNFSRKYNVYFGIIGKSINLNESFVDACAIYLNNIIGNLYKYAHNYNQYRYHLELSLIKERKYILGLATKVLKYYNYSIINNSLKYKKKRTECTHVTSYYVIKAFLYKNLESYRSYLIKYRFSLKNINLLLEIIDKGKNSYLSTTNLSKLDINNSSLKMSNFDSLSHS